MTFAAISTSEPDGTIRSAFDSRFDSACSSRDPVDEDRRGDGVWLHGDRARCRERLESADRAGEERVDFDRLADEIPPTGLGFGEAQQIIGELTEPHGIAVRRADRREQRVAVDRGVVGQLKLRPQGRDRCPEVVRDSGQQRVLAADGNADSLQHGVERPREAAELVELAWLGEAPVEIVEPDRVSFLRQHVDRPQRSAGEPPPTCQ
jgi:hypothetical protein